MNPLLAREVRARWRDGRAFGLVFALAAGLSLFFAWVYSYNAVAPSQVAVPARFASLGHTLFGQMAWIQTLAWLLISPALTSSAIAYERERGWFDGLLLSPLLPRQIALGKWLGALLYAATLYCVTLPFAALTLLLGGVSPAQFALMVMLHALCAGGGAAIGLAASSWSYRSHSAQRSASGLVLVWLLGSLGAALWAGEAGLPFRFGWVGTGPLFWRIVGRTNPVLGALSITQDSLQPSWPYAFAALTFCTLFFLSIATYYARRPLEEAPFIEAKRPKKGKSGATHAQIPLLARLKFRNPVLNREVRSKFRLRQPPLSVIIAEGILALMVAYFYVRTFYNALFEPNYRPTIWWGLIFTATIVSMMAAAVMGGNGFSRERESGTWEGVQLSLLSRGEVLRGKIIASMVTCTLFSIPVWPLLLPCISWTATRISGGVVTFSQATACALIWTATVWSYTLVGLWVGRNQLKSARAAGQTLGLLGAFIILSPALATIWEGETALYVLGAVHPLVALGLAMESAGVPDLAASGAPYFAFHAVFGALMCRLLARADLEAKS